MIYKIKDLQTQINNNTYNLTELSGIYRVLNLDNIPIIFTATSTNTKFTPYDVNDLQDRFNASGKNEILYIGKAKKLEKRIKQYIKFGLNQVNNHKGGRSIFQIKDYDQLYIEIIACENCECVEKSMLIGFRNQFGTLPMANRQV